MKNLSCLILLLAGIAVAFGQASPKTSDGSAFGSAAAARFADLALVCVHKEYPNKISHLLNSDTDVAPPRQLTPAFYGCMDWHSSVHGHWLLARLARTFPDAPFASAAQQALEQSLTRENIAREVAYLQAPGRASFERPYGLAWLLQLGQEMREWGKPAAGHESAAKKPGSPEEMSANLLPLEKAATERIKTWMSKLSYPIRIGEHNQTAFSMGLMLDYARSTGDREFAALLTAKARQFYLHDTACPLAYEPSGEDFLSPCLAEADGMRRVLPPTEFAAWLHSFLPQIPTDGSSSWLKPVVSPDPSDPKLAHLDGLNLSRAWMLEGIASALPENDLRLPALRATAAAHRDAGLAAVTGKYYEGGHWLGSFAVYLVTRRGI